MPESDYLMELETGTPCERLPIEFGVRDFVGLSCTDLSSVRFTRINCSIGSPAEPVRMALDLGRFYCSEQPVMVNFCNSIL